VPDAAAALAGAAGLVNATPVGMAGFPGLPLSPQAVGERHWLADVIYTPLETELVVSARTRGATAMGGSGMCVHQAAESFRLFTGRTADLSRLRKTFAAAAERRGDVMAAAG
jgi:shikimate dehydrogenase